MDGLKKLYQISILGVTKDLKGSRTFVMLLSLKQNSCGQLDVSQLKYTSIDSGNKVETAA